MGDLGEEIEDFSEDGWVQIKLRICPGSASLETALCGPSIHCCAANKLGKCLI